MSATPAEWNTHLPNYPHRDGVWREQGLIVGEKLDTYPKLFKYNGNQVLTWKDNINENV